MQPIDSPTVSIIIVSYNSTEMLRRCLDTISLYAGRVWSETIVVDNASTDRDVRDSLQGYPWVRLVSNQENLGFARANNQGIRLSMGKYTLLLNPDAELAAGAVESMIGYMDTHSEVAVLGPCLMNPDGSFQPSSYCFPGLVDVAANLLSVDRMIPTDWMRGRPLGEALGRRFRQFARPQSDEDVDWVTGACMLVRRSAFEAEGMLDEHFFMYFEEIDWCLRFKRGGWKVAYLPTVRVLHRIGQSSLGRAAWSFYQRQVSATYYFAKHYGRGSLLALALLGVLSGCLRAGASLCVGIIRGMDAREPTKYYWKTARHFSRVLAHGGASEWLVATMQDSRT